jgi:nucleoside-diphosphate-sugar epimerase
MILNIGTGTGTSLEHLHVLMVERLGRLLAEGAIAVADAGDRGPALGLRQAPPRPGEPNRVVLDPSRAAQVLEWAPWTSLGDGIDAVLAAAAEASAKEVL